MAAWFGLPFGCLSMPLYLEVWVTFLSGLSRKLDVFLSASTSCLTDIMKPRSNVEPGRDEQRFPADQKNESWDIPLPARWEFILSYPDDRYLSTHITDTSCQNNCSCWWFQRCHSDWVSQPRYRHKSFGGLSWEGRYEDVPPVGSASDPALLLFHTTQTMPCCCCRYILIKWNVQKCGWKDGMSIFTPLWSTQTYKGINFRTCWLDYVPALGVIRPPPWQGLLLQCFSPVLMSAEITK